MGYSLVVAEKDVVTTHSPRLEIFSVMLRESDSIIARMCARSILKIDFLEGARKAKIELICCSFKTYFPIFQDYASVKLFNKSSNNKK